MTGGGAEATGTPRPSEMPTATAGQQPVATDPSAASDPTDAPGSPDGSPIGQVDATRFAHASEAEMARILDFYDVRWDYEPTTFPILWNLEGDVVESFAPDFYLPELDVYLEMTTLKQRLVRKKNRKLRRLKELYPGIRIKLFYARDFRAMMLKYGRLGLAQSLSGTSGQVVPDRALPVLDPAAALDPLAPLAPPAVEVATILAGQDVAVGGEPMIAARDAVPVHPRATPRSRGGRRRRGTARATEAGAEREAEA